MEDRGPDATEKPGPAQGTKPEVPASELTTPSLPEPPAYQYRLPERRDAQTSAETEQYRQMGLAYTLPAALIAPVIVLTLLGAWLDSRFSGNGSGFTIGGAILGLIVGVRNMLRIAARLDR